MIAAVGSSVFSRGKSSVRARGSAVFSRLSTLYKGTAPTPSPEMMAVTETQHSSIAMIPELCEELCRSGATAAEQMAAVEALHVIAFHERIQGKQPPLAIFICSCSHRDTLLMDLRDALFLGINARLKIVEGGALSSLLRLASDSEIV